MERFEEIEKEDLLRGENNSYEPDSHNSDSHSDSSPSHSHSSHSNSLSGSSYSNSKSPSSHSSHILTKSRKDNSKIKTDSENINLDIIFLTPEDSQDQFKNAGKNIVTHHKVICTLKPNSLLYHPQSNITYTVHQVQTDGKEPTIIITDKNSSQDNNITVTLETFNEYTVHRELRVLYVNSLNKTKELCYPVNINWSFEEFCNSFASTYKFPDTKMTIIFREAKVKNLNLMKFSAFDFDTDCLIVLELNSLASYTNWGTNASFSSSPVITSYVAFIKKNIQLKAIKQMENELMSSYFEIYRLSIKFDKRFIDKSPKTKSKLAKQLLKANWREKATVVYTIPLTLFNEKDDSNSFIQNVVLNENTVYVIIMHLYLRQKKKKIKLKAEECWIESEFELISENEKFCFEKIELSQVSELFIAAKD